MANRAYLRLWTRDFSATTLLEQFVRFLALAPLPERDPYFERLTIQPIEASLAPIAEWELRGQQFGAAEVAALAAQHLNGDTSYNVAASWDLWQFDIEKLQWAMQPAPLLLSCHGPDYDGGIEESDGPFAADLGFEDLFTGHAGLLAKSSGNLLELPPASQDPAEHTFRRWMAVEANLRQYHQKTRENIQRLTNWMEDIPRALPVERQELYSEGEENFEARLDEILAVR